MRQARTRGEADTRRRAATGAAGLLLALGLTAVALQAYAQSNPARTAAMPAQASGVGEAAGVSATQKDDARAEEDTSARPAIEAAKAAQLTAERRIAGRVPSAGGLRLARDRPLTLRDSGVSGTLMFARGVDFRVTGDLGFTIHSMAATLVPGRAGAPVVFDDPTSLSIDVHRGSVTLDAAQLTAIFNRYLFDYQGSPLRNMRVVPQDGALRITGEMRRDGWVPIVLTGTLAMRNAAELAFHPTRVEVAGVDASRLMRAAHVKMSDLLKVDTPVARLDGDDVIMQVAKLTPPPLLRMTIARIETASTGVSFTLDDGTLPRIDWPAAMPPRGMLLVGGDVKFMRSMPMNVQLALEPLDADPARPFVFDLYGYRRQMAAGYFTFDRAGALDVRMPSAADLPPPVDARPAVATTGRAAARLNDSFLRRQQAALAEARAQWRREPAEPVGPGDAAKTGAAPALDDERRSSGAPPLVHMENVDFYLAGGIGFYVRSLDARMVPKRPGQPVDLDDPDQYDIDILDGEVVEPWPAMAALFNDYLLDYSPRSLNHLTLTPRGDSLEVSGGIKLWNHFPGVWLPATLRGTIGVHDERHIVYSPRTVSVLGVPQAGLLRALHVPLASLTPFARRGVKLEGNDMVFDQYTVFPPPMLKGRLGSATVTEAGLVLTFLPAAGTGPAAPARPRAPRRAGPSYVWIEGGDVKMFDSLVVNGRTLIRNSDEPQRMRFDLYGYRRDVALGKVRMDEAGALDVDLAPR